ncbi:MAG: ABC transporter permease [Chloracidobacterium sp.]|nr:ABC transporter permease [Chloracidobacterium sp.]
MKRGLYYIVFALALVALWQYFGSTNQTVRLLVSSPSLVTSYFVENLGDLLRATWMTMLEAIVGLLIATFFSFAVMILCFYRPRLMDYVLPLMVTSQVIPLIVLAPFFIILLGIGLSSKIAMAALMCFFPIFVNFAHGFKSISTNVHELLHIYNASRFFRIVNVYFPLSFDSIVAGLKISATLAVIGAIVAEFNGAEIGLGKNLYLSAKRLEPEMMISSLVLSTLIGFLLFGVIRLLENKKRI